MAFNMDPKKCPMPTQDPNVRNKNFEEVALGYTAEMAVNEAKRCIHCKNKPCQTGCPVGIDIPEFIGHVAEGDFEAAYQVIARSSSLPAVCGRVCPQESQCEGKCTRGIKNEPVAIGRLERFVADWHRENVHTAPIVPEWNGHKVAIIGAGPAGLTAAGDLAKLGYKVTVYEALHVAGGVLMYGIPEFRLPKAIVQQEIDGLKKMGVDFECNMVIGKVLTIDELMDEYGYEAVFVGSGAGLPRFMGIPGESLKGVYSANEFLTRSNLMKAYLPTSKTPIRTGKKVAVVGGGIGTAPMYQLTRELAAGGVKPDVFFGFRDKPYCMEEYRSIAGIVKVSTDTGAVGFHGFVTQLYDPADYDVVLVCGPTVMMKNAARLCAEKGTPCFVSMEKKMACGIGACLGCTCETKGGEGKSVCKNGPVFDATEVFF